MFSLFKKKASGPKVNDLVFAKKQGKWNALLEAAKREPQPVFVAWFEKSMEDLQSFFQQHQQEANIITFRQVHSGMLGDKPVVFIEHYPLFEKEHQVFSSLNGSNIFVYSSLDEAFFLLFGGDRIAGLMEKMGLQDNEAVSHSMVTRSIANAQEKLAAKITMDQSAYSMEEWIQKNLGTIMP